MAKRVYQIALANGMLFGVLLDNQFHQYLRNGGNVHDGYLLFERGCGIQPYRGQSGQSGVRFLKMKCIYAPLDKIVLVSELEEGDRFYQEIMKTITGIEIATLAPPSS